MRCRCGGVAILREIRNPQAGNSMFRYECPMCGLFGPYRVKARDAERSWIDQERKIRDTAGIIPARW